MARQTARAAIGVATRGQATGGTSMDFDYSEKVLDLKARIEVIFDTVRVPASAAGRFGSRETERIAMRGSEEP
jgi:hypothetical protein